MSLASARRRFKKASRAFSKEEKKTGPLMASNPKARELIASEEAVQKEKALLAQQKDVTPGEPRKRNIYPKKAGSRGKKSKSKSVIKPGKKFLPKSPVKLKGIKI